MHLYVHTRTHACPCAEWVNLAAEVAAEGGDLEADWAALQAMNTTTGRTSPRFRLLDTSPPLQPPPTNARVSAFKVQTRCLRPSTPVPAFINPSVCVHQL